MNNPESAAPGPVAAPEATPAEGGAAAPEIIHLAAGHALALRRGSHDNTLEVVRPDGHVALSVSITPQGITLNLDGPSLTLRTTGALAIDAEQIALRGRNGVALESGGDARLVAAGDLYTEARVQNLTATRGNVNIKANDDVKLDGERIKLNC